MSPKLDQPSLAVFKAPGCGGLWLWSEECVRRVCTYLGNPTGFLWILWAAVRVRLSDTGVREEPLVRGSRARPLSSLCLHLSLFFSQSGVSQGTLAVCLSEGSQGTSASSHVSLNVCVCARGQPWMLSSGTLPTSSETRFLIGLALSN